VVSILATVVVVVVVVSVVKFISLALRCDDDDDLLKLDCRAIEDDDDFCGLLDAHWPTLMHKLLNLDSALLLVVLWMTGELGLAATAIAPAAFVFDFLLIKGVYFKAVLPQPPPLAL
jgi:hypothetical protein